MADKKVSQLTSITNLSGDDLLLVVNDPAGTPTSRKVTVNNLFGNVVVDTTHKNRVTFKANTAIRGTVCTVSANVIMQSVLTVNNHDVVGELVDLSSTKIGNTTARALISKKLDVSNATVTFATKTNVTTFNAYVANTNPRLRDLEANSLFYTTFGTLTDGGGILYDGAQWRNTPGPAIQININRTSNTPYSYTFSGGGTNGSNNETLYLYKGFSYLFDNGIYDNTGQLDRFKVVNSYGGSTYANNITGNNALVSVFTVPHSQIANLYYESSLNGATMRGRLVIVQ